MHTLAGCDSERVLAACSSSAGISVALVLVSMPVHGNTKTGVLSVQSGHGVVTVALGASLVVTAWHVVFCEV